MIEGDRDGGLCPLKAMGEVGREIREEQIFVLDL